MNDLKQHDDECGVNDLEGYSDDNDDDDDQCDVDEDNYDNYYYEYV